MPPTHEAVPPALPIPISRISQDIDRYFLYSADTISWLRREHHILGVLVGTLAQIPQQNVFLGIPLELQPEEARLLVEEEVAYIVDDLQWHRRTYADMTNEEKEAYRAALKQEGQNMANAGVEESRKRSEQALKRRQQQRKGKGTGENRNHEFVPALVDAMQLGVGEEESLFGKAPPKSNPQSSTPSALQSPALTALPHSITPSSSLSLLPTPPRTPSQAPPNVKSASYALFKHLHKEGYFMSPGLRFGCQYLVYPGDPLRFHSHFLAMSAEGVGRRD